MTSTDDDAKLAAYAADLRDGLAVHIGPWVERVLRARVDPARVEPLLTCLADDIARVMEEVATLLDTDIDAQQANPLAIVRSLVPAVTEVLRAEGLAPVRRDPDAERLFPDDEFDLTPGAFADLHPDLHMPGLAWGAAKAHVHLQRRRAEGLR